MKLNEKVAKTNPLFFRTDVFPCTIDLKKDMMKMRIKISSLYGNKHCLICPYMPFFNTEMP